MHARLFGTLEYLSLDDQPEIQILDDTSVRVIASLLSYTVQFEQSENI